MSRGPAPTRSGPVLLTHKRQERKTFRQIIAQLQGPAAPALSLGVSTTTLPATMLELGQQLGIRTVVTPATGNCLAMAIVQAAADSDLNGSDLALDRLTASLKRGVKHSGLLHLEDQLAHDHRVQALANVKRVWATMTRQESASQMRWILEDFATSPSGRTDEVSDDTWGGSDVVRMAAIFYTKPSTLCNI
uniref:Uncharacterized protein n=1 Tax=Hyaloperonospora arabidopsidis (strain Emoy2) TaxID=559515 RepID=M4BZD0_HYAAE